MKIKQKIIVTLLFFSVFFAVFNVSFSNDKNLFTQKCFANEVVGITGSTTTDNRGFIDKAIGFFSDNIIIDGVKYLLFYGVLIPIGFLVIVAVSLIEFAMSDVFMSLLSNEAIYQGWETVRDFLNIFFIFFLLFSAFATIFQVSRYHIKSTWVMIVVMALLVNFSWPVSRVIIDLSNVTMFHIMGNDGAEQATGSLLAEIGSSTQFAKLLIGQGKSDSSGAGDAQLLRTIVAIPVGFMYMVTMGAIAMILIIRVIALAILLVFAPVGFVFAAFPSTKSYSSQWWSSFMKYAFTGPILLFMLLLSVSVMSGFGNDIKQGINSATLANGVDEIAQMLMGFMVTISILWAGIIAAGKLGDGATSLVVGKATGAAKGVANKVKNSGKWVGKETGQFAVRSPGVRNMMALKNRAGASSKRRTMLREQKAAQAVAGAKGASANAMEDQARKSAAAYGKENLSISQAKKLATQGDSGAMLYLQKEGKVDVATYKAFSGSAAAGNAGIMNQVNNEMAKKNAHEVVRNEMKTFEDDKEAIAKYRKDNGINSDAAAINHKNREIIDKRINSLSAKALSEQSNEFHEDVIAQESMSQMDDQILDETIKRMSTRQRKGWQGSNYSTLRERAGG